ncbi:MAG: Dabb family protein [Chloroflexi bacterium]|nr:Dabb family protein [Chloroflexota bacterium]
MTTTRSGPKVQHLVLFRVRPDATPAQIEAMLAGLRSLASLDGVEEMAVGANFSERSGGFTHALSARFRDRAALAAYGPHPAHQKVVQELTRPINEETVVVDYEIP